MNASHARRTPTLTRLSDLAFAILLTLAVPAGVAVGVLHSLNNVSYYTYPAIGH